MNKRGIATWSVLMFSTMPAYVGFSFISVVAAAVVLTPSHRERKAVEKCEISQSHDECVEAVKSWDKATVLAYIKDEGVTGNGGNFPGGNSN
jgi:hypothetical protein